MKNKKIIIGLVGSGKTTLYRKINEEQKAYAVEIELPQSCRYDEKLKKKLFKCFYKNKNIDIIILHPYYLPCDFVKLLSKEDQIEFLEVSLEERKERIIQRSKNIKSECKIFDENFIKEEEEYFKILKKQIKEKF